METPKYYLKKEHENDTIIVKNKEGRDTLITKKNFNDYYAEMIIANNYGHLIQLNHLYDEKSALEKKTFTQISEGVISLTSTPEQIAEKGQNQIVKESESKPKRGRPFKQQA